MPESQNKFAAVACLTAVKEMLYVMLIHHVETLADGKIYKSYWALPGGGAEDGETTEQTIQRELEEETGCIVSNQQLDGGIHYTVEVIREDSASIHVKEFILTSTSTYAEGNLVEDIDIDRVACFPIESLPSKITNGEDSIAYHHFEALLQMLKKKQNSVPWEQKALLDPVLKSLVQQKIELGYH